MTSFKTLNSLAIIHCLNNLPIHILVFEVHFICIKKNWQINSSKIANMCEFFLKFTNKNPFKKLRYLGSKEKRFFPWVIFSPTGFRVGWFFSGLLLVNL
jgi:hypothetical protein